jgi:general secretion pathway protein D
MSVRRTIPYLVMMLCLVFASRSVPADEAEDLANEVSRKKQILAEEMAVIAEQHLSMGEELFYQGDYDRALDEFNTVLDIQPDNGKAKDYRLKCINAIAGQGAAGGAMASGGTQARTANQVAAVEAYRQGLRALKKNRLDEAVRQLRISVELDNYYVPSKRLLHRALELQSEFLDRDHDVLWRERINDVREAWLPTGRADKLTISKPEKNRDITSPAKRKMIDASKQIIPEINFTQAHLRDVLQYLSKITGVNIILDEYVFEQGVAPALPGEEDEEITGTAMQLSDTITISLTDIPLIEALRYILKIKGLKYRIDDYAILVSTPERIGSDEMETRYYNLSSGLGEFTEFKFNESQADVGIRQGGGSSPFGAAAEEGEKTTIRDVLLNSGVPFPPGSSVFMDKRTGTLIVHNTPENLSMVERILEIIDKAPFQINIQAKFVRISQSDLEEMGFEWLLRSDIRVGDLENGQNKWQINADNTTEGIMINNALGDTSYTDALGQAQKTTGAMNGIDATLPNFAANSSLLAFSGILTDPQFRVIIHALDKSGNADLLSAPSVTTVNNQQAQIELVDEIIYPSEYDLQPPTISDDGGTVTPGLAVPGDFVTRDVGVILNVTPSVGSDRKTINLTLIPEVSELQDWKDYGVTYTSVRQDGGTITTQSQTIPILQPVFRTSNVSTSVIVNDGETVVLGGLIEEKRSTVRDRTPILGDIPLMGRLFRHDYEQTQKLNLMIFVTARLITATGEDLHPSIS